MDWIRQERLDQLLPMLAGSGPPYRVAALASYIQHSAHIAPGREGLFSLVERLPPTLRYEPGLILAEGDFVIAHGRFSDFGLPVNWVAADILRIEDGILVEHWDVIQDEATKEQSKSGNSMFGDRFPIYPGTSQKMTVPRHD
jgi:predicted SnoaL-like aldol condensation-catalyzing enzyme